MEKDIPFTFGMNTKVPAVTDSPGFFVSLQNILPIDSQLKAPPTLLATHPVGETIYNILHTYEAKSKFADIFAFGYSSIWRLDAAGFVKIQEATQSSDDPWACVPWRNEIFFTRLGTHLRKVAGTQSDEVPVVTSVATSSNQVTLRLSARYAVAAHDHLWLGHVQQNGTLEPTSVRWSDLYNPEVWEISETSESDRFSFSVNDSEITGLETHHNKVIIFTTNSIWSATYEGLPTVYGFEPLYSNLGCAYHYSVIKVQEDIFFISTSGVYKMSSFSLQEVGSPIWDTLRADLGLSTKAQAIHDEDLGCVYWNVNSKTYVFNYVENRWAVFTSTLYTALKQLPSALFRTLVINQVSGMIDSYSTMIDAGINTSAINQTAYYAEGTTVYQPNAGQMKQHTVVIETPYFFLDSLWSEKELSQLKLAHKCAGTPTIDLMVQMKDSFNGQQRNQSVHIISDSNFVNESIFQCRNNKYGKLLKLYITYVNLPTGYVSEFVGVSMDYYNGKSKK